MTRKNRKSPNLSNASVAKWAAEFLNMARAVQPPSCPHIGTGNAKTRAVNEGTLPIVTCLHGDWSDWTADGVELGIAAGVIPACARFCYDDAWQYYQTFFSHALLADGNLRLNESGRF